MPVIRISDLTWQRLKKWAEPLEDTPDDALAKVLDAVERHDKPIHVTPKPFQPSSPSKPTGRRGRQGQRTHLSEYRGPILISLSELGGSATAVDVLNLVYEKMRPILVPFDLESLEKAGTPRWHKTANFARFHMKDDVLKSDSPHGIWELNENGIREATQLRDKNR